MEYNCNQNPLGDAEGLRDGGEGVVTTVNRCSSGGIFKSSTTPMDWRSWSPLEGGDRS